MKKRFNVCVRYIVVLCCVCMLAAMLIGCEFGTFSSNALDNPKLAINGFIDAMQSETFDDAAAEEAMAYIGNYSTMGFEKYTAVEDDDLEKMMFELLRSSYAADFYDNNLEPVSSPYQGSDMNLSGKNAFVTFSFTSLNIDSMSEVLAEAVNEAGREKAFDGVTFESEESAMELVLEVFPNVFDTKDLSAYCVSREITVELIHTEDGWKICVNDELYDALLGRSA